MGRTAGRKRDNRTKQIVSRVLFRLHLMDGDDHSSGTHVTVCLKRPNPEASSEQLASHFFPPEKSEMASLFGLAPGGVYQAPGVTTGTGALLPHRFTLTEGKYEAACRSSPSHGGLFSVALSLGSPPLDVIQHPALWSPDFPPPAMQQGAII